MNEPRQLAGSPVSKPQIDKSISSETAQPFHSIEIMKAYREQITRQPKPKKKGGWPKPRKRRAKRRRNGMRMA